METFDLCLFPPKTVRWRLSGVVIQGGVPVAGAPKASRTDGGGFWVCEMSGVWVRGPDALRAARAFEARMDHGASSLIVPDRDRHLGPGTKNWAVVATVAEAAALRATTLAVEIAVGTPLVGGEHFSIDHPTKGRRMYRVASVEAPEAGVQEITIRPPLRESVTGETLDFNTPSCTMRLLNAEDFFGSIEMGRWSDLSPVFGEVF